MSDRQQEPVVVVRLDSDGDVLLAGPAVRAVARGARRVVLVVSPAGSQAGHLLPGVDDVLVFDAPWTGYAPSPVDRAGLLAVVDAVAATGARRGVILTSYHQSSLPAALMLRLAGVAHITAVSEDYPGSLLDVRLRASDVADEHEVHRALRVAAAAGFAAHGDPLGDALAVRTSDQSSGSVGTRTEAAAALGLPRQYVVVHPSASVPARAPSAATARSWVAALRAHGHDVVVTGAPGDQGCCAVVAADGAVDLAGRTSFAQLTGVLAGADAVVVGNTGPAHLAAAVGTPVVSAFAPVVGWEQWRPWRVPVVRLGDQDAPCAGTRARQCPVPGHPCLDAITADRVVAAVATLTRAASARSLA